MALTDGGGTLVLANLRLEEMFGYPHAELAGRPALETSMCAGSAMTAWRPVHRTGQMSVSMTAARWRAGGTCRQHGGAWCV